MAKLQKLACIGLAYSLVPECLIAQDNVANPEVEASTGTPSVLGGGELSAPDRIVSNGYRTLTPSAQISSEDGSIEVDFGIDYAFASEPKTLTRDGVDYITGGFSNMSLKVNVPLGDDSSELIDFKSFGKDGSAKFSFTHFMPKFASGRSQKPYLQAMVYRCVQLKATDWIETANGDPDKSAEFLKGFAEKLSVGSIKSADSLLSETVEELEGNPFSAVAEGECVARAGGPIPNESAIASYFARNFATDSTYIQYKNRFIPSSVFFLSFEGGAGINSFDIADETNFLVENEEKIGFDFNGSLGQVFNGGNSSWRVGLGYARIFEAQDDIEFCRATNMSGGTECINGQNGSPVQTDTGYAEISFRQVLARRENGAPSLAIAPTVTYIFEEDGFQGRLPLFLQSSEENGLDAGVQAIYNESDDEFGFGVFIGVPFGLVNR